MGASGNLSVINLNQYDFEFIKNKLLTEIISIVEDKLYDENDYYYKIYFQIYELKSFQDFIQLFWTKIVDYCPDESGIYIGKNFYSGWKGEWLPQIIDNHLILYDTDQQMKHQNMPTMLLNDIIIYSQEIWT